MSPVKAIYTVRRISAGCLACLLAERTRPTVKVKVAVEPVSEVMCEALPSVKAVPRWPFQLMRKRSGTVLAATHSRPLHRISTRRKSRPWSEHVL